MIVDALTALLDGPRARRAFLLRSVFDPPWSLRIEDRSPLTLVALVRGHAWVVPECGEPVHLDAGDVAVMRGPDVYTVADHPTTPPQVLILPGQRCTTLYGDDLSEAMDLGVRTWGNSRDGAMVMLTGTYQMPSEVNQRLLASLPALLVVPADGWDSQLVPLLATEIAKEAPGQAAFLDRLLDLLLISVLRAWFTRQRSDAPGWFRALGDPVVGRALRMLYNNPAHPWTVAGLAAATGLSRAALARRFTEIVGEPPMTFLTGWRLALAADLLREPDAKLDAIARQVGYGSSFALSAAFKRAYGMSPTAWKAA